MEINALTKLLGASGVAKQLGTAIGGKTSQAEKLIELGLPTLLQGMTSNASSKTGAQSLLSALTQHADDDIEGMAKNISTVDTKDGGKILKHIFSGKSDTVTANLAEKTGLDLTQVTGGMSALAPIVMGFLGKQQKQEPASTGNIASLLGGMLGGSSKKASTDILSMFLDKNKDGNIADDVIGMIGGFLRTKKKKK